MSRTWSLRLRWIVGTIAALALIALALVLPRLDGTRLRGVVDAGRTFRLAAIAPGQYQWVLESGAPALGPGVLRQRSLEFARADLVEMALLPGVASGQHVTADTPLASLTSGRARRELDELKAQRDQLDAERELLQAGGRPESVEAARKAVEVAKAKRDQNALVLARALQLQGTGAAADAELDAARSQDAVLSRQVSLAQARLSLAERPPRPEELADVDARIAALDARIAEVQAIVDQDSIASPIDGYVVVGGVDMLRVDALDPVYVRMALPETERADVAVGDDVAFEATALPGVVFEGHVSDVSGGAAPLDGRPVFLVAAEIANPDASLRPGMTGTARVSAPAWWTGMMAWLGRIGA